MTPNGTINVSVAHLYGKPDYNSEIISQGLLGERVEILEEKPLFTQILQADGYQSWVSSDQVFREQESEEGVCVIVRAHFLRIYSAPSEDAEPVGEAVLGCRLKAIDSKDVWYHLRLPGGVSGWARQQQFGTFPEFSCDNILSLARELLGYQYSWGGRSTKGFDCSGFVQTVFGLHGVQLPRDAWQQQENNLISNKFSDARAGDLLFFSKTPGKVTHVGIALGNGRFIHASGRVKYNSFNEADHDFSSEHVRTFTSVNRYLP